MSGEIVKIKGSKTGLQLSFAANATYEAVLADIKEKLVSGSGFFLRGTLVQIPADAFSAEKRKQLNSCFMSMVLFAEYLRVKKYFLQCKLKLICSRNR